MGVGCGCGSPLDFCLLNLCARVDDGLHCILIPLQTRASKTHGARFRVERARERGGFRVESARARTRGARPGPRRPTVVPAYVLYRRAAESPVLV